MAEYIEREAVLSCAKDICVLTKWDAEYRHRSIDPCDVKEIPAADVAPVRHGEWMFEEYPDGYYSTYCSKCESRYEEYIYLRKMWNYCPNCGARMDEEEADVDA